MSPDEVVVDTELYDDEIPKIEAVVKALNHTRMHKATTVEGWRNEVTERFAEAGFRVTVVLHQIEAKEKGGIRQQVDQVLTSITIVGRVDDLMVGEYDHERQGHAVRAKAGMDSSRGRVFTTPKATGERRSPSGLILPE